jgi:hypothetical protein
MTVVKRNGRWIRRVPLNPKPATTARWRCSGKLVSQNTEKPSRSDRYGRTRVTWVCLY